MSTKRKAAQLSAQSKKAVRQTKLTQHFGATERCPTCTATFTTVEQLIQHVESAHLSSPCVPNSITLPRSQAESRGAQHDSNTSGSHHSQQQAPKLPGSHTQQQVAWWNQVPEDPVVAHVRFTTANRHTGSQSLQPVRLSALGSIAPVELILQALPSALASTLLTQLLAQSGSWVSGSWWFGGQQQTAPRSSATFTLNTQVRATLAHYSHDVVRDMHECFVPDFTSFFRTSTCIT